MSLGRLASWCFRRRRLVVALWIVALIAISVLSTVGGAESRDNFALPGTSSQRAYDLLGERFPKDAGDSAQVVLKSATDVNDAASKAAFEGAKRLLRFEELPKEWQSNPYILTG